MTYEEAHKIVQTHLNELSEGEDYKLVIIDNATINNDFGWVFFYNSNKYIETHNFSDMLVGTAPIIISRKDGSMHETGTAEPVEYYIENLKKYGKCFP